MNFSRNNTYHDNTHSTSFPSIPPSLSADDHGMREDYAAQGVQEGVSRSAMHSLQDVKPYLGLRSRLSQVWINRWTILILLVLVRVLIAIGNLHDDIDDAKAQALAACSTVESLGSNMASLPHYLSTGVNSMAADGVTRAVDGLETILFDIITAAEEIFVFWVNMMYGVYECLITFAVTGSLHGVVSASEDITKFLNSTIADVGQGVATALNDFNNALKGFESAINDVSTIFTGKATPPASLDLSSEMNKLNNLQLPTSVSDELTKLNNSIPNFDQVKNATNNLLRLPFEEVKKLMNESLGVFQFNQSVLPVPAREQLTFCDNNDGIDSFFDGLYDVADTARKVFIVVLILAALIACVPMGYMEIRRWRSMQTHASRIDMHAVDGVDGVYIASRPWTSLLGIKLGQRFRSEKGRILARWFVSYITTVPALVLLSIGLAALFSCFCQWLILKAVSKEVPELAEDVMGFADKVVWALGNASEKWANETNKVIIDTNNDINQHVFGWVNTSTTAVNNTLNTFVDDTINVLNQTFGGTILYEPIMDVYTCLVGMKVAGIEAGLTWVTDHAHIDFPLFPDDVFSAGAKAAITTNQTTNNGQNNSFLADPTDQASDKITESVAKLATKIENGIRTETILALCVLLLYVILVLMGLARVLYTSLRRSRVRAIGGPSHAGDVNRADLAAAAAPATAAPSVRDSHRSFLASEANAPVRGPPVEEVDAGAFPTPAPPVYQPPKEGSRFAAFMNRMPGTHSGHDRKSSHVEIVDEKGNSF